MFSVPLICLESTQAFDDMHRRDQPKLLPSMLSWVGGHVLLEGMKIRKEESQTCGSSRVVGPVHVCTCWRRFTEGLKSLALPIKPAIWSWSMNTIHMMTRKRKTARGNSRGSFYRVRKKAESAAPMESSMKTVNACSPSSPEIDAIAGCSWFRPKS